MILKSLSRKSNSGQLIKYVLRYVLNEEKSKAPGDIVKQPGSQPFIIRHNVRSRSVEGYIKEFEKNETFRLYKRKDSVKLFHSILSFSPSDRGHISEKLLKDVAQQFIELRCKNCLVVGAAHKNTEAAHLHIVSSGTQLNGRSARISKQQLHSIKLALEAYQKEKYPELIHSLPDLEKRIAKTREEIITSVKKARQTHKQSLMTTLEQTYSSATSLEEFLAQLEAENCTPYYRNGKLQGITYENKKYRLTRLGFDDTKLSELNAAKIQEETSLRELQSLRSGPTRAREKQTQAPENQTPEKISSTPEELILLDELAALRGSSRKKERSADELSTELERSHEESDIDLNQNTLESVDTFIIPDDLVPAL